MTFAIPAVGSDIEVCMANPLMPTARYPGEPDRNWYRGKVMKSLKWMSPEMFCLSTDIKESPIRILDQDRILDLRFVDGSAAEQVELTEKPKFQMWQVDGSKDNVYTVTLDNGKWSCDCVAGKYNRPCKHVKKIQEELNG
jgi:hypothetical protein